MEKRLCGENHGHLRNVQAVFDVSSCLTFVFSAGSGTTVHDSSNDFVEEDYAPQLDYKGAYGQTHSLTHSLTRVCDMTIYTTRQYCCLRQAIPLTPLVFKYTTLQYPAFHHLCFTQIWVLVTL